MSRGRPWPAQSVWIAWGIPVLAGGDGLPKRDDWNKIPQDIRYLRWGFTVPDIVLVIASVCVAIYVAIRLTVRYYFPPDR